MILAILVLYNPNIDELKKVIDSVYGQVDTVYLIDNSSISNQAAIEMMNSSGLLNLIYNPLFKNKGIAKAQNLGIEYAKANGYSHILLLDQDSILTDNIVNKLLSAEKYLSDNCIKTAAVGPSFLDVKTHELVGAVRTKFLKIEKLKVDQNSHMPVQSDHLIASGSLICMDVINEVGGMREDLFIDWVDIEWGERCNRKGYHSYVCPSAVMMHSIGDDNISLLGRDFNLHSDFRNYFIIRNAVNLLSSKSFTNQFKLIMALKVPWYTMIYTVASEDKWRSFKLYCQAIYHGATSKMGLGYYKNEFDE